MIFTLQLFARRPKSARFKWNLYYKANMTRTYFILTQFEKLGFCVRLKYVQLYSDAKHS